MKTLIGVAALLLATAAQAQHTQFAGTFAPEAPGATGSGTLFMEYDHDDQTLFINASFQGLSGTTTNAHIHCCTLIQNSGTAGVALATSGMLPGFPLGVQSGTYTQLIDLTQTSNYNAAFVTASGGTAAASEARLIANLESGNAYFNIHSSTFGGGEIRAFVTVVPEPAAYGLMLAGFAVMLGLGRHRRV